MKLELGTEKLLRARKNGLNYICETEQSKLDFETITQFIDDVYAGKIRPSLKSEPIPTEDDGAIKVLVGDTHFDAVNDPTKHVFVEYYAPWCGYCKKLAPIWAQLAEEQTGDVVIAKMDSTKNENEAIKVDSYPTLVLYTKDNKKGIEYPGERELEDIKKFIEEHTSA